MIEVVVTSKGKTIELAHVRITNMETSLDEAHGDYSVEFGVDTAQGFAIYQRPIFNFPRKELNVLALLRLALETLDEKELSLDGDPDNSSTTPHDARRASSLARGLDGPM